MIGAVAEATDKMVAAKASADAAAMTAAKVSGAADAAKAADDADPFILAYREKTGRTPSSLEAATVDAGKLVAAAARSDADTRGEFRQALLAAELTDTVTGVTKFDPETLRLHRQMLILTITRSSLDKVGAVPVD